LFSLPLFLSYSISIAASIAAIPAKRKTGMIGINSHAGKTVTIIL